MGSFNSGPDPEQEYRRRLLAAARRGKAAAREELQREFHVRVYSPAERAELYYEAIPKMKGRLSQRHLDIGMEWAKMDGLGTME